MPERTATKAEWRQRKQLLDQVGTALPDPLIRAAYDAASEVNEVAESLDNAERDYFQKYRATDEEGEPITRDEPGEDTVSVPGEDGAEHHVLEDAEAFRHAMQSTQEEEVTLDIPVVDREEVLSGLNGEIGVMELQQVFGWMIE